jgi:hypothetical protein
MTEMLFSRVFQAQESTLLFCCYVVVVILVHKNECKTPLENTVHVAFTYPSSHNMQLHSGGFGYAA